MTLKQYKARRNKLEEKANHIARALADYMLEEHDPYFKEFEEALKKKLLKKYKAYTKAIDILLNKDIEK